MPEGKAAWWNQGLMCPERHIMGDIIIKERSIIDMLTSKAQSLLLSKLNLVCVLICQAMMKVARGQSFNMF